MAWVKSPEFLLKVKELLENINPDWVKGSSRVSVMLVVINSLGVGCLVFSNVILLFILIQGKE